MKIKIPLSKTIQPISLCAMYCSRMGAFELHRLEKKFAKLHSTECYYYQDIAIRSLLVFFSSVKMLHSADSYILRYFLESTFED